MLVHALLLLLLQALGVPLGSAAGKAVVKGSGRGDTAVGRAAPQSKTYPIEGRIKLNPRETIKPTSMRVAVDGGKQIGIPRADGTFVVYGVTPGTHYLEVFATGLQFPQLRLLVSAGTKRTLPGEVKAKVVEETSGVGKFGYPLVLEPRGRIQYFEQHQQVSIMRMIMGNPTVLMMGVMGVMCYALPKMMENMDPEELKKMQEEMKDSPMQSLLNPGGSESGAKKKKQSED